MNEEYENRNEVNEDFEEGSSLESYPETGQPEEGSYEEEYEYEEVEANEIEFNLTEDEINEWINELVRLRDEKSSIELDIDEENALKINYEEGSENEGDSEDSNEESFGNFEGGGDSDQAP
ncbi:MAG: hypothetical protein ABEI74_01360 [Candidatus Pacearchaeota archaeon]